MNPDATNALPERWLPKLCSKLSVAQSVEDVQTILDELGASWLSDNQVEGVLRQLLDATEHKHLLELVLAYGSWSRRLSAWLLKSFPKHSVYVKIIHHEILERLSCFLFSLPCAVDFERQQFLSEARFRVERIPYVLKYMCDFPLDKTEVMDVDDDPDDGGFFLGRKRKQSHQKKSRKMEKQNSSLNPQDLARLNVTDPRSTEEALSNASLLLDILRRTFSRYFDLLREPEIYSTIQSMFVLSLSTDTGSHEDSKGQPLNDSSEEEAPADITPAAYPCIQPMSAALYFESASVFGDWRILISSRADRDLREVRRGDAKLFKVVITKIVELSNGQFSDNNQRRLNNPDVQFPIYAAKVTGGTRLVYQIDCIHEYDSTFERQVIKIFGIYTQAKINKRFWDSMGHQLSKKGKAYRDRCTFRMEARHEGDYVITPAIFPPLGNLNEVPGTTITPELPKEDLDEIHSLLVLEKFVALSKELLKSRSRSIFVDLDVAHVFDVSPREKEIIEHKNSCYVIGRSGTGKTTTMLFKMLGIERAYTATHPEDSESLSDTKTRQIFVTHSRKLATYVEDYFRKLSMSLAATTKSKEELKEIAAQQKLQKETQSNGVLFDLNDDVTWKAGLPQRFSLLQDEHFPLFLTFERLCQLLLGDVENAGDVAGNFRKGEAITYNVFFEQYWPHFSQDLTKSLDPALVFSELLGVIKGSEQSLSHETRYLDLTAYRNLSHRAQHVFAKQRDQIFLLFHAYMKLKQQRSEYDTADRTHHILKAFDASGVPGTKIDHLYVDEAQDNLLIDAMLLRSLCRNPNGLFWAGDTAQTIAIGSSFRFNDLKAFLYRLEQRREQGKSGVTQSELRTFQLAVNYRSHAGIVRCATAVIELITHFWPYAIDSLEPEHGVVDGAEPLFFSDWDPKTVLHKLFLSKDSGQRMEFGARQCILVRNERARAELQQDEPDIGSIFTLYESKGLEFDDVLLYKFFEDSTVDINQWRVVLNLVETPTARSVPAPRFDEARHAGVCSELKFLYVAITRARKNVWIVDCSDKAEPMKTLWDSKGYIKMCVPGGNIPQLSVSSTDEEWATAGHEFFTNRNYSQATRAFKRAGLLREAEASSTHQLRDTARSIQPFNKAAKRDAFRSAADSFLKCARGAQGEERRVFFHNAADCFENAGNYGDKKEDLDHLKAARAYKAASEYTSAVRLYKQMEMFDDAVRVIREHRDDLDEELANNVWDIARLFYFKNKELRKARTLFESEKALLEYLEKNPLLDDCHATVLANLGRYQEAADIHLREGRPVKAIVTLFNDKDNEESKRRANDCILQELWESTSFAQKIKGTDTVALDLLKLASKVDKDTTLLSPTQKDELELFQGLRKSDNTSIFRQLADRFLSRQENIQAMLCFDHYFVEFPSPSGVTNADLVEILKDFGQYCCFFRDLISRLNVANKDTQKIFNFHPTFKLVGNTYRIKTKTWLYQQIKTATVKPRILEKEGKSSVVVSGDVLQQLLEGALRRRLEQRILDENTLCQSIPVFTPCLPFVVNGKCHLVDCPRYHVNYQELTQDWFNCQVRIHLSQIAIYGVYLQVALAPQKPTPEDHAKAIEDRRYWIHRLHETLRPTAHYLGSEASVRLALKCPEAVLGRQTVVKWLRDVLGNRELPIHRMLLTFLCEGATLLMFFNDVNAMDNLMKGPLFGVSAGQRFYRRLKGTLSVVPNLYRCMRAADRDFISSGVQFFQQVVDRKITIEVNVLCHVAEFLAGCIILAHVQFDFHNLTLPRSWILTLLRRVAMKEPGEMLLGTLLRSMQALLRCLIEGDDAKFLLVEGLEISALRCLFIHRICQAMALIGYNIPNKNLRVDILKMLGVIRANKAHACTDCLFKRFATARSWGGIAGAVQNSCTESRFDEMVQLWSNDKPSPQKPPPNGIRRVFFKNPEDIPSVLSAGSFEVQGKVDAPNSESSNPQADAEIEQQIEEPEEDFTDFTDSQDIPDPLPSTAASLATEDITQEQRDVALRLLKGYRNLVYEQEKSASRKRYDSYFDTCLKMALDPKQMQWSDGFGFYYRKLYLGLVPHLLTCVRAVEVYAQAEKEKTKQQYKDDTRLEGYDDLHNKMNEVVDISKTCKRLNQQLIPSSKIYKNHDIDGLKRLRREVTELVDRVPSGACPDIQLDLQLAIKAIIKEPKARSQI